MKRPLRAEDLKIEICYDYTTGTAVPYRGVTYGDELLTSSLDSIAHPERSDADLLADALRYAEAEGIVVTFRKNVH
jgi:hypothetical protein